MISVILPCLNELRHGYLPRILDNLSRQQGEAEIIAVLSPSQDATADVIRQYQHVRVLEANSQNRAQRLNYGLHNSQGDIVLLHHPATLLPSDDAFIHIATSMANPDIVWGGFRHSFDLDHWLLRFTSWYSTYLRPRWGHILYLDHCIFARRDLLIKLGGVPDMDIFEDTVLSQKLASLAPPHIVEANVMTSARRFKQRGIYRQALLNQSLKLMYYAGISPAVMNRLYERHSQINVLYGEND